MSDDVVYVKKNGFSERRYHEESEGCDRTTQVDLVERPRDIAEAWYEPCKWCATDDAPERRHEPSVPGPKSKLERMIENGEIDEKHLSS